ncbi:hypothetical protein H0H87_010020 [Tephrocybe sp. NHM501043]|nr:hypothetical protein H0H87_010020 [Tephrocybe sp. NHM501043]
MSSLDDAPDVVPGSTPRLEHLFSKQLDILQEFQTGAERHAKLQRDLIGTKLDAFRNEVHPILVAQRDVLTMMNTRQEESDTALRSFPPVPTSTPSVWTSLSTSVQSTMNPEMERLRSSLDALLVFLGLFSAIIAAFFIESSKGCREDEAKRTNELLRNLTNIILAIHNTSFDATKLPAQVDFIPEPRDLRATSYWAIALIFSLLIAALAVVCRGFLSSLIQQKRGSSLHHLTLTWLRWKEVDRLLKPAVQSIPFLMVFPCFVFIIGFLDSLFSLREDVDGPIPIAILAAFSLSATLVTVALVFVLYFILHGYGDPLHSPFQSWLNRRKSTIDDRENDTVNVDETSALCEVVKETFDVEPLEKASSMLTGLLKSTPGITSAGTILSIDEGNPVQLDLTRQVISYLLSPNTTLRTGITVSSAVARLPGACYRYLFRPNSPNGLCEDAGLKLIVQLSDLAERAAQMYGFQALHNSEIITSIDSVLRMHFEAESIAGVAARGNHSSASVTLYWLTVSIGIAISVSVRHAPSAVEILSRVQRLAFDYLKAKAMSVASVLESEDVEELSVHLAKESRFEAWDMVIDPKPLQIMHGATITPELQAASLRLFTTVPLTAGFHKNDTEGTLKRYLGIRDRVWTEGAFCARYFAALCRKEFSATKSLSEVLEVQFARAFAVLDSELLVSMCNDGNLSAQQENLLWMFIIVEETLGIWEDHHSISQVRKRFREWLRIKGNKEALI